MEEKNKKSRLIFVIILIIMIIIGFYIYMIIRDSCPGGAISDPLEGYDIIKFNDKFYIYEGTRTGTQIKQLIKSVSTSNISNPEHQVRLVIGNSSDTILWTETTSEDDGVTTYTATNAIINSKKYEVSTSKGKDSMIETITITEKNNLD